MIVVVPAFYRLDDHSSCMAVVFLRVMPDVVSDLSRFFGSPLLISGSFKIALTRSSCSCCDTRDSCYDLFLPLACVLSPALSAILMVVNARGLSLVELKLSINTNALTSPPVGSSSDPTRPPFYSSTKSSCAISFSAHFFDI